MGGRPTFFHFSWGRSNLLSTFFDEESSNEGYIDSVGFVIAVAMSCASESS